MYDTILLATDGSDNAQLAARRAIDVARERGATLHVLYVVERSREDPSQTGYEEHVATEHRDGTDVVEAVEQRATEEGVETKTSVERGVARTTIEEYASEYDVDLVVLGSTGASGPSEKLLGTVSKYVVNEVPADVLVVRPDETLE